MKAKVTNVRILELVRLLMKMSNNGTVFVDLELSNTPEKPNRLVVHPIEQQRNLPPSEGPLSAEIIHISI